MSISKIRASVKSFRDTKSEVADKAIKSIGEMETILQTAGTHLRMMASVYETAASSLDVASSTAHKVRTIPLFRKKALDLVSGIVEDATNRVDQFLDFSEAVAADDELQEMFTKQKDAFKRVAEEAEVAFAQA